MLTEREKPDWPLTQNYNFINVTEGGMEVFRLLHKNTLGVYVFTSLFTLQQCSCSLRGSSA